MNREEMYEFLKKIKNEEVSLEAGVEYLKDLPYKDLDVAKLDLHRGIRSGYPEVIYCQGKDREHLKKIIAVMMEKDANILATRADEDAYSAICEVTDKVVYHKLARICIVNQKDIEKTGLVAVATGGTADIPVAEEAAVTLEAFGNKVDRIYDVGVAGIHRLLLNLDRIRSANAIVAVAGMEGALPSVVAGLVDVPVIAVPTSVGYGANFKGVSALLTMLNSCAAGIGVVNIDNGFGAAYLASQINKGFSKSGVK